MGPVIRNDRQTPSPSLLPKLNTPLNCSKTCIKTFGTFLEKILSLKIFGSGLGINPGPMKNGHAP